MLLKATKKKKNSDFFEAYILLALDSLKKNNVNKATEILSEALERPQKDPFNSIILNILKQYFSLTYKIYDYLTNKLQTTKKLKTLVFLIRKNKFSSLNNF